MASGGWRALCRKSYWFGWRRNTGFPACGGRGLAGFQPALDCRGASAGWKPVLPFPPTGLEACVPCRRAGVPHPWSFTVRQSDKPGKRSIGVLAGSSGGNGKAHGKGEQTNEDSECSAGDLAGLSRDRRKAHENRAPQKDDISKETGSMTQPDNAASTQSQEQKQANQSLYHSPRSQFHFSQSRNHPKDHRV